MKTQKANDEDVNTNADSEISFCFFCNKKADFKCGLCFQATYCTAEHQKADWPSHKRVCIRPQDKLKQLYKHLQSYKKVFFQKLSKKLTTQCEAICDSILKISEQIVTKFPSPKHEIQYGTAICCYVKMLLAVRSFNEAQQILNNYLKNKDSFLKDLDNIPQKLKPEDPNYSETISFVEGKLKLLSVLSNLTHQAVRNSVFMIEILLKHCEKFYGKDSLQVSNVYFELGNYYNFMNQSMKACGCYLIAGNIRKQKGTISYYNAALILIKNLNYKKALYFLEKCLEMTKNDQNSKGIIDRIYIAMAVCYQKLNYFEETVENLQKALCQMNLKDKGKQRKGPVLKILKILSQLYKDQFSNEQMATLPKEKTKPENQIIISNANLQDYWDLDADTTKKKKMQQWMKSFKNETDKTKFESKIPMNNSLVDKLLFANHFLDDRNEEAVNPSNSQLNNMDYINVDLQFMSKLSSTEVKFLNQLNRIILINKDKPNFYDAIQNSNFIQQISKDGKDKVERFYGLNPELIKKRQDYQIIEQQDEDNEDRIRQSLLRFTQMQIQENQKGVKPKLDLSKLPRRN